MNVDLSDGAGGVSLRLVPTADGFGAAAPQPRRWGVAAVVAHQALEEDFLSVSIRGGRAEIGTGWPRGDIATAELLLTYGRDQVTQEVDERDAFFDVAIPVSADRPGSLLILFRDAEGEVVTARGTVLPPGDFAAG